MEAGDIALVQYGEDVVFVKLLADGRVRVMAKFPGCRIFTESISGIATGQFEDEDHFISYNPLGKPEEEQLALPKYITDFLEGLDNASPA